MKLTVANKTATQKESPKKELTPSQRGKRSRNKGATFERKVAKTLQTAYNEEFVRTPQSGGFVKNNAKAGEFRGDVIPADEGVSSKLHIECKNAKTWSLSQWLKQAQSDCPKGKIPCVVFHQDGTSNDFITMSLKDFLSLIPKESVIIKEEKL